MIKKNIEMRSSIFFICAMLSTCFVLELNAQKKSDTSFMLLWYRGKKINDSTLLKTTGETVRYSPSQSSVGISYAAGRDPLSTIRKIISRSEEIKTQMDRIIIPSIADARPPGMVVAANEGFDEAMNEVMAILENRFPLEPPVLQATIQEKVERFKNWPPEISASYNAVMKYVHQSEPGSLAATSPPPSYSFDYCYPCDKARTSAYSRDSAEFINSFLSTETLNMNRATSVLVYIQKQKRKFGPDSLFSLEIRTQMYEAMVIISERIENKLINVWNTYKSDAAKVPFLVELMTRMSHIHELMGFKPVKGFPDIGTMALAMANVVKSTIRKAKDGYDFTVLLNVRRIAKLLGFAGSLGLPLEEFTSGIEDYLQWNQFKVTVDADAKIAAEGLTEMARLRFDGIFNAFPDSACKLKWYPHGMDSAKGIIYQLKEIAMITPQGSGVYTGTYKYASKKPWLKLDFCDETRDSALFYPFFPYEGRDTWSIGDFKDLPAQMVQTVYMFCFMDAASLKKRTMSTNPSSVTQQINAISQKAIANASNTNFNPSTMTTKDYERAAKLMDAADEMIHLTWYSSMYYFPLKGRLRNFQPVVFDEMLDGKKISQFSNIEFATFKVRIEHFSK
jgi:hypothetical protein